MNHIIKPKTIHTTHIETSSQKLSSNYVPLKCSKFKFEILKLNLVDNS
jgi:hypothetical protein